MNININRTNKTDYTRQAVAFKGHQAPSAEMLAFSSSVNRQRFLNETESVRKNDFVEGQSFFSFLKDTANNVMNALNETPNQKSVKAGLNVIG
ncbi:MAG: hypothetical protein WCK67_03085 [bacterium]